MFTSLSATTVNLLNLDVPPQVIEAGHLQLGGVSPEGVSLDATSFYLRRGDRPFVPVFGEFHFSRYPQADWAEALRTMKAGGVSVVATYVFWNIHERAEGELDFSGDLDLRAFVRTAQAVGLEVVVRLGPFCHGEMRNGGLPDWLYGRDFEVRSNDAAYLAYVDRWYGAIARELVGLTYAEGGPIIGVQVENEYQHSAAPWELTYPGAPIEYTAAKLNLGVTHIQIAENAAANPFAAYGQAHMRTLREMAEAHSLKVPYVTATGWGNAAIAPLASLPVSAAYAYPFWAKPSPSPFFLYRDLQQTPDYAPVSYEAALYPAISAEVGPGIQPKYSNRPYFVEESLAPMMVRMLGSGSNGIGYYMYHGGTTPMFDGRFWSEEASGLPKMNYDFQAPLGQYGQVRSHFHETRLLHHFLAAFGDQLAPCQVVLPAGAAELARTDTVRLRYAGRVGPDGQAFVFVHHFQDHLALELLTDQAIELSLPGGEARRLPATGGFELPVGTAAILPVNFPVGNARLASATVQPLTHLTGGNADTYVFFSHPGLGAELVVADGELTSTDPLTQAGPVATLDPTKPFLGELGGANVLVLPRETALQAYPVGEHLVISDALVLGADGGVDLRSVGANTATLEVYPALPQPPVIQGARLEAIAPSHPAFSAYRVTWETGEIPVTVTRLADDRYAVHLEDLELAGWDDAWLQVRYVGDRAGAFIRGQMITDHLWHGKDWEIRLQPYRARLASADMILRFHALPADAAFLETFDPEHRPAFAEGEKRKLEVQAVEVVPQFAAGLRWE